MNFDRLDKLLQQKGISRRALANAMGINENKMSSAFKRRSGLSADDVLKIADFLGVSPYYLEGWNNDPSRDDRSGVIRDFAGLNQEGIDRLDAYDEHAQKKLRKRLTVAFDRLSWTGQQIATERVEELAEIPRYTKEHEYDHEFIPEGDEP